MEKIQNTRKSLPRRIAVTTGGSLLAVVAGLGMAPAGAHDDVKAKAEADGAVKEVSKQKNIMILHLSGNVGLNV